MRLQFSQRFNIGTSRRRPVQLQLSSDDLRPIVAVVVQEMLTTAAAIKPDRIGYSEREAAELIGLPRHVLRDCRLRGEIHARKVGKQFIYAADELRRWLIT
jgi:hypothetical protein